MPAIDPDADLAAQQARARAALPPDSPWAPGHVIGIWFDFHASDVAAVDGGCFVRLRARSMQSMSSVDSISFRRTASDTLEVLPAVRLISSLGGPGGGSGFDVAVPVDDALRHIAFGNPATVVWERDRSTCARRID
jgi:hypothetical protein